MGRFLFIISSFIFFSCSTNVRLIYKSKRDFGLVRFYEEKQQYDKSTTERIYASVNRKKTLIFYCFYPNTIVKTTSKAKELCYTVFNGHLPATYDTMMYQKFSPLDTFVLAKGDKLLDSLGLSNFKRASGTDGFEIEVCWYHGYPKHKKFRP